MLLGEAAAPRPALSINRHLCRTRCAIVEHTECARLATLRNQCRFLEPKPGASSILGAADNNRWVQPLNKVIVTSACSALLAGVHLVTITAAPAPANAYTHYTTTITLASAARSTQAITNHPLTPAMLTWHALPDSPLPPSAPAPPLSGPLMPTHTMLSNQGADVSALKPLTRTALHDPAADVSTMSACASDIADQALALTRDLVRQKEGWGAEREAYRAQIKRDAEKIVALESEIQILKSKLPPAVAQPWGPGVAIGMALQAAGALGLSIVIGIVLYRIMKQSQLNI